MGDWVSDCEHAGHDFVFEEGAEGIVEGRLKLLVGAHYSMLQTHLEEFTADPVYDRESFWVRDIDCIWSGTDNGSVLFVQVLIVNWCVSFRHLPCAVERGESGDPGSRETSKTWL